MPKQPTYDVLVHDETLALANEYAASLSAGRITPGRRLASVAPRPPDGTSLIEALLRTKLPQVYAESALIGDGSDWRREELKILGGLSIAVTVTVYDDGRHQSPRVHAEPFEAGLVFVPGILLRNDAGRTPLDWDVVGQDGQIAYSSYLALTRLKLLPALAWIQSAAILGGGPAVVTVPGIGAGQFAGRFRGTIGAFVERALRDVLGECGGRLTNIGLIYYDPYGECDDGEWRTAGPEMRTRPFLRGGHQRAQLCRPEAYAEGDDNFADSRLYSIVAWDPISWPGNDFLGGMRATDDGVKAAATDTLARITGIDGVYDPGSNGFVPEVGTRPPPTWEQVIVRSRLQLSLAERLHSVADEDVGGRLMPINSGQRERDRDGV